MTDATHPVRLYAFTCGWLDLRKAFLVDGHEGRVRAPVPAYLIEHPKGRAVFDTGMHLRFQRPDGPAVARNVEFDAGMDIAARLRAVDIDPASIRWIVNSHMHTDHCGGNALLPNATIVVQRREYDFARGGEDKFYVTEEYDTGHTVLKVDGEHDLFGDGTVVAFPTPGHTPGHQSLRVRLPEGDVILAADCCNMRLNLDLMRLPDHCHDAEQSIATLERLRDLRSAGARIFFGHDPEFWETVPQSTLLR